MVPQHVARTAIGNCTRTDGSKSQRRKRREIKHYLEFIGGVLVIPLLLVGIHAGIFMLLDQFYTEFVPDEWVDEIERADTDEGEVGEALDEFAEWQEQQQNFAYSAAPSWHDALRNHWIFFAADLVLMGILVYWLIGPLYVGLVANYREGVERRHRHYLRVDQERAREQIEKDENSDNLSIAPTNEVLNHASGITEEDHGIASPHHNLNDFIMEISQTGFLDALFRRLELPSKLKSEPMKEHEQKLEPAECMANDTPADKNTSLGGVLRHRIAQRALHMERLREVENKLGTLRVHQESSADPPENGNASEVLALENEIKELKQKISKSALIDSDESVAPNSNEKSNPTDQAVLFCLMDASGSMGEIRKDIAKRFFILLYLFLKRTHEHMKVVYIRHHTSAQELDEDGFFQSRETGGTVISSGLRLMHQIIAERFPGSEWNIYAAQVSDGDNWDGDSPYCRDLLKYKILPSVQYYVYVETTLDSQQTLWREYEAIKADYDHFDMQQIDNLATLYPMFRDLLEKQVA